MNLIWLGKQTRCLKKEGAAGAVAQQLRSVPLWKTILDKALYGLKRMPTWQKIGLPLGAGATAWWAMSGDDQQPSRYPIGAGELAGGAAGGLLGSGAADAMGWGGAGKLAGGAAGAVGGGVLTKYIKDKLSESRSV